MRKLIIVLLPLLLFAAQTQAQWGSGGGLFRWNVQGQIQKQDSVRFIAGSNVTLTQSGNTLTIAQGASSGISVATARDSTGWSTNGTRTVATPRIVHIRGGNNSQFVVVDADNDSLVLKPQSLNPLVLKDGVTLLFAVDSTGLVVTASIDSSSVVDGTVSTADLRNTAVDSTKIKGVNVTATKLASASVLNAKIATAAVDSNKIAASMVTSTKIKDGEVLNADLASSAVDSNKIKASNVTSTDIKDAEVLNADLANSSVDSNKVKASNITSTDIKNGDILNADLANSSVDSNKVKASNIASTDIKDAEVLNADLAGGAVSPDKFSSTVIPLIRAKTGWTTQTSPIATDTTVSRFRIARINAELTLVDVDNDTIKFRPQAINMLNIVDGAVTLATIDSSGAGFFRGGLTVGISGTLMSRILLGSATLDIPNTTAGTDQDLTITVTNAADGNMVVLGVPNGSMNANSHYLAWVSSANTVTVRFHNDNTVTAIDPASGTFRVTVIQP